MRFESFPAVAVRGLLLVAASLVVALAADVGQAAAPHPLKGVALVIGETDYVRLPTLANPDKDARDIDHMLDDLGFEVTRALDVRTEQLRDKIDSFLEDAKGADVALVYYAGHGIEAGGEDYIMGIDADIDDAQSASATLVPFDDVLSRLQKTVPITIVLLDACRTNPFTGQQTLQLADISAPLPIGTAGLEAVRGPTPAAAAKGKPDPSSLGVVVGFSASPGQSALDGPAGQNSPYASALLQHLSAGGYSFGDIMTMVTNEVYVDTGARQLPWTNSSLTKVLYFGRNGDEAQGDDAEILSDRRKLLLDIASVPDDQKHFVEALATQEDLKLSDLYAMEDIISSGKAQGDQSLDDVAKRVREVLDDPILSGAPTDPELLRLDGLANKALAAGAFKRAFDYRQEEAKRAGELEKGLDAQQASVDAEKAKVQADQDQIDATRKELAGVYARVAEAAMYNLNPKVENDSYNRAAKQSDLFDKTISIRLRLRAANVLADQADNQMDLKKGLTAIALYQDILKEVDQTASPTIWADTQLRMGEAMWHTANPQEDRGLRTSAVAAARAALTVFKQASDFRRWSRAERLLSRSLKNIDQQDQSLTILDALMSVTPPDKYPLDYATGEDNLAELYDEEGYWWTEYDTEKLQKAIDGYQRSREAFSHFDQWNAWFELQRKARDEVALALRTHDRAAMLAGLADGRAAIAQQTEKDSAWGREGVMLGISLSEVAVELNDPALAKEAAKTLAAAETVITEKTEVFTWAQARVAEGDALRLVGTQQPQNAKLLKAAIAAYADGYRAIRDLNYSPFVMERAHVAMVRLQALLGVKIDPDDAGIARIPPPAVVDFSSATANVSPDWKDGTSVGYRWRISGAMVDGKPTSFDFDVSVDYLDAAETPHDVDHLRIDEEKGQLSTLESMTADYTPCGDMAQGQNKQVRLHYGREGAFNACILGTMAPADAAIWQGVWLAFPALVKAKDEAGDPIAKVIDELLVLKPIEKD